MHNVIKKYFNVAADFLFADKPPDAKAWRYRLLVPVGLLLTVQIAWYPLRAMKDILWHRFPDFIGEIRAILPISTPVVAFVCGLVILSLVFWQKNPGIRAVRRTLLVCGGAIILARFYSGFGLGEGHIGWFGKYILPVLDVAWPFVVAGYLSLFDSQLRDRLAGAFTEHRLRQAYNLVLLCWCASLVATAILVPPFIQWDVLGAFGGISILPLIEILLQVLFVGACGVGGLAALAGDASGMRKWGRRALALFAIHAVWVLLVWPLYSATCHLLYMNDGSVLNPVMQFLRFAASGVCSGVGGICGTLVIIGAAWLVIAGISLWKSEEEGKA
ncbi:MAG: hypothetical protein WC712_05415 [Candidatus Brocadiia bacterium]